VRRYRIPALLLGLGLAAAAAGVATTAAAHPAAHSAYFSTAQQAAARAYWTPRRLASARNADALADPGAATATADPADRGRPYRVPAAEPRSSAPAATGTAHPDATSPQPWTSGGLISSTAGKVFFSNSSGTYACSGDAVNSGNKSIVATAGHCVVDADTGEVYQNWVFIPGYDHGNRPHGTFTASSLHWMPERIGDSDPTWDAAFATMSPLDGVDLVDAVGGEGIGFDQTPGQYVYSFGYGGSDAEGNGEQLNWCAGTEIFESGHPGGGIWGIDCVQTGGSSGGPFLQGFDTSTGTGTQIGNISVSSGDYEWHPYYGSEAHDAYNEADAA
jgi:trypsin-like peptidase